MEEKKTIELLRDMARGDIEASGLLYEKLHEELHSRADGLLAHERPGQTLDASALVNEVFVKLIGRDMALTCEDREHFLNIAVRSMRQILIDIARRKSAVKHGGEMVRHDLADSLATTDGRLTLFMDRLDIHEALDRFRIAYPQEAKIVEYFIFLGRSLPEIADVLKIPLIAVKRGWSYAKVWLYREIKRDDLM